jgi:predicted transcriptional regulator
MIKKLQTHRQRNRLRMKTGDIAALLGVTNRTARSYYTSGQLTTGNPVDDFRTLVMFCLDRGVL